MSLEKLDIFNEYRNFEVNYIIEATFCRYNVLKASNYALELTSIQKRSYREILQCLQRIVKRISGQNAALKKRNQILI